ncbi:UDP-galactose transporter [Ostertagia ostertagi]
MAEIVKLVTCIVVLFHNHGWRWSAFQSEIHTEVIQKRSETLKVAVPAVLYVIQNNLLFLALSKLDAATYQVTYQLKILTTAFFSVTMLGRSLNRLKWLALIMLTGGVALVQMPAGGTAKQTAGGHTSDSIVGLLAVLAACFSSGFAGVYFEKILKTTNVSLWMRNLQLGFLMCWLYDYEAIQKDGFLQGYNNIIWIVVMLQVLLVLLSTLFSSFASWFFLECFAAAPDHLFIVSPFMVAGMNRRTRQPPHTA